MATEASSVTDAAVDLEAMRGNLEAVRWERDDRTQRAEEIWGKLRGHGNFLGCEAAEKKASDIAQRYVTDIEALLAEVERLKAQATAQAEVIKAAREIVATWNTAWAWRHHVADLAAALARLDALEHAQCKAAAVTQLQADMEAKA